MERIRGIKEQKSGGRGDRHHASRRQVAIRHKGNSYTQMTNWEFSRTRSRVDRSRCAQKNTMTFSLFSIPWRQSGTRFVPPREESDVRHEMDQIARAFPLSSGDRPRCSRCDTSCPLIRKCICAAGVVSCALLRPDCTQHILVLPNKSPL